MEIFPGCTIKLSTDKFLYLKDKKTFFCTLENLAKKIGKVDQELRKFGSIPDTIFLVSSKTGNDMVFNYRRIHLNRAIYISDPTMFKLEILLENADLYSSIKEKGY